VQDGEHRDLMLGAIAAEGEAHAALLAGEIGAAHAAYLRAVDGYRASWALSPPRSYGRLVGLLKAAVLAGEAAPAATEVRDALDGDADADGSPVANYALAVAALALHDDAVLAAHADVMDGGSDAFQRTARALRALAAGDADGYGDALAAIEADFATREEHLTGIEIADTAVMLERLAEERGLAAHLASPLVPVG